MMWPLAHGTTEHKGLEVYTIQANIRAHILKYVQLDEARRERLKSQFTMTRKSFSFNLSNKNCGHL